MDKNGFYQSGWRPALAWIYCVVCLFDFTIMPIFFNLLQYYNPGQNISEYTAITLQGSGLFHISMGAVIGIGSHGKSKERVADITTSI